MLAQRRLADLVVTLLQAAPAVAPRVTKRVARAVSTGFEQAVLVRVMPSRGEPHEMSRTAQVHWQATVLVECLARSGATNPPDEAVSPLVAAAYARLMAGITADTSGFQLTGDRLVDLSQDEFDEGIARGALTFTVRWLCPYDSLEL